MAERRMFAKTIVLSDAFLDMPMSARCLYFTLSMLADDDGFINNPKSIMRQCGSSLDDMNILLAKRFILAFESGVIVIKHWKIHNYIQKDRYKETKYVEEKSTLTLDDNGAYTECIQDVSTMGTQVRDRARIELELGEDSVKRETAAPAATLFAKLIGSYTFSDALKEKMSEWFTYKVEKRQTYKERGMTSLLTRAERESKKHGDKAICDLIDLSMTNNWNGIFWERLEKKSDRPADSVDFRSMWDSERGCGG